MTLETYILKKEININKIHIYIFKKKTCNNENGF